MNEGSQTISFRLPPGLAKQLEENGVKEDLSRNEYARKLVLAALAAPSAQELLTQIQDTKRLLMAMGAIRSKDQAGGGHQDDLARDLRQIVQEVSRLRFATATGLAAVLARAGGVEPKEAEAWVRQNMLSDDH